MLTWKIVRVSKVSVLYIYIDQLVIYASKSFLGLLRKAETMGEIKEFLFAGTVLD